jgi:hypothetical protein
MDIFQLCKHYKLYTQYVFAGEKSGHSNVNYGNLSTILVTITYIWKHFTVSAGTYTL